MPVNDDIRFEPDERPPALLTLNVALQGAVLIVTNVVTFIVIYSAAFDDDGSYAEWAVVGALAVAGVLTALHASRLGPGCLLLWGSGIPFMVPCILAVEAGGPGAGPRGLAVDPRRCCSSPWLRGWHGCGG